MATIKHKKAICAAEVSAFGGIDASTPCGDGGIAVDLKNFKVLPDGSLCRRNGFSVYRSFADDVRGAEVFADTNGTFLLAAVGSTVHRIPLGDGEDESADVLHSTEGEVTFFSFLGEIYLVDGLELYRLVDGALFEVCRGYVPLYGKNWNSEKTVNPINEPINLASDKVRFHYEAGTMFGTLYFGVRLASVERVVEGDTERFYERTLSEDGTSMTFKTAFRSTKPITVYATVDPSYFHDAELRACHGVAKYDAFGGSRVMLYGGGDGARIFISRPVNATSLAEAREEYPNATSLYIPKGGDMTLESRSPITAMARVGDRMMIATANETWISETVSDVAETETVLPLRSLSRTVGCLGAGGLAVTGGDAPVTVSAGGLYLWQVDPQLDHAASVRRISGGIAPLLPSGFTAGLRVAYVRGEDTLWLYDPEDEEGRVFLYDCTAACWYSYTGIRGTRLLEAEGRVGFFGDGGIYFFEEGRGRDLLPFGERDVVGSYRSRLMDFGDGEVTKRAVRLFVDADLGGGELSVALRDGKLLDETVLRGKGEGPSIRKALLSTSRFRRVQTELRASGPAPQRIYGFCVHASGATT